MSDLATNRSDLRDPDPVSVILATLGAVGSIASIVSLMQAKRAAARHEQRIRYEDLSELIEHLASAEAALAELSSVLSRIQIIAEHSESESLNLVIDIPLSNRTLVFGEHGLMLGYRAINDFLDLQDKAFRYCRNAQRELGSVFKVLNHTDVDITDEHFKELVSIVAEINSILSSEDSIREILVRVQRMTNQAGAVVHALRENIIPGPDSPVPA